jgi:hypothetical protein
MKAAQRVTRRDIDRTLANVERALGPDEANQLRAYLAMLESQAQAARLESDLVSDDDLEAGGAGWQGALA